MTGMRVRWPNLLASIGGMLSASANAQRKYELQAASEFLFEQRPSDAECADRTPGQRLRPGPRFVVGNQPPYRHTRLESLALSRSEVPALTIAADASESVQITGDRREDWSLRYCAYGEGSS